MKKQATIAIIGDGGWGTTLALHLNRLRHPVRLWGAFPDYLKVLRRRRQNVKFLPGIRLPRSLHILDDLSEALSGAEVAILAVPSQYMRSVIRGIPPSLRSCAFVNVAKGLELRTQKLMSQVIQEELGRVQWAVLSGPNVAHEMAKGHPASAVIASPNPRLAKRLQHLFNGPTFRIYTSTDTKGVQLGGALKNPMAIAAGICDGLGFGTNSKAALITRAVVELARLGKTLGAREETFWGLSGLGDLITTAYAGRNRFLGEQMGKGRSLSSIIHSTSMVFEGVDTTKAAWDLGRRHRVELPIINQVHAILFRHRAPRKALQALMERHGKPE